MLFLFSTALIKQVHITDVYIYSTRQNDTVAAFKKWTYLKKIHTLDRYRWCLVLWAQLQLLQWVKAFTAQESIRLIPSENMDLRIKQFLREVYPGKAKNVQDLEHFSEHLTCAGWTNDSSQNKKNYPVFINYTNIDKYTKTHAN